MIGAADGTASQHDEMLANIKGSLEFLERTGVHPPATAAAAYVEHVPWLLDEVERLRAEVERQRTIADNYADAHERAIQHE